MSRLKISIDRELQVMIDLGISAEEWFFIQLLFLVDEGYSDYLYKYFTQAKKDIIPKKMLENLMEKGIIDKKYKIPKEGEEFNPEDIPLSKTFIKKYLKSSVEIGMELMDEFPPFIVGKTGNYPIKNITKFFKSIEDFAFTYAKSIKFDPLKHKEVIELLIWAKDNNLITFNLCEFVISRKWEDLERMKGDNKSYVGIQVFDTTQII